MGLTEWGSVIGWRPGRLARYSRLAGGTTSAPPTQHGDSTALPSFLTFAVRPSSPSIAYRPIIGLAWFPLLSYY